MADLCYFRHVPILQQDRNSLLCKACICLLQSVAMKETPFYELSIALKDRPRGFQIVVITCLILSSLVIMEFCVSLFQTRAGEKNYGAQKNEKKDLPATASVQVQYK